MSAGPLPTPDSKPLHKVGSDLIGEEDKYAALRISEDDTASAGRTALRLARIHTFLQYTCFFGRFIKPFSHYHKEINTLERQ